MFTCVRKRTTECLLSYRQARFVRRVLSTPKGSGRGYLTAEKNGADGVASDGVGSRRRRSGTWGRREEVSGSASCHHRGEESIRGGRDGERSGHGMDRQEEHGLDGWIQTREQRVGCVARRSKGRHNTPPGARSIRQRERRRTSYHPHMGQGLWK